ncbi:MAG: hypothetical protein KGY81_09670, partial [Phycisphaerae bacterium]|nr:hypothetical protein [Phycisphaerae bacterium]
MSKTPLWLRFSLVAVLVALSAFTLWGKGLRKGLDIVGGYSLIFEFSNPDNNAQMGQRIIGVLRQRLDPQGLSGLEIQPLQDDRFEIRMPAASDESRELRNRFIEARQALMETNIERGEVRDLLALDAEQRQQRIQELSGGDADQATRIRDLFQAMQKLREAEKEYAELSATAKAPGDMSDAEMTRLQESIAEARN